MTHSPKPPFPQRQLPRPALPALPALPAPRRPALAALPFRAAPPHASPGFFPAFLGPEAIRSRCSAVQVRKLVPGWGGTCPGSQGEGTAGTRALAAHPVLSFALGHADSSFLPLLTFPCQRDKSLSVWQRSVGPGVPLQTDRQTDSRSPNTTGMKICI